MPRSLRSKIHWLVLGCLALVLPRFAAGQEPQAGPVDAGPAAEAPLLPPPVPEPPPGDIEAIEITGEREDTNVQDEAEAVTRFGMEDLDRLNITNVDGLASNVPGLHVGQQGQAAILTLRGIGTENASITGESAVAFHVDGISYARPTAARVAFYDIHLIDVTRGPQGLLGGKNSTSGSINVETNDPGQEYEVQGDVLFGNYDRVRSRGVVNLPLGEFAAFRTAYFYEQRDGYLDNKWVSDSRDPFDADSFGFRSKLRLTPSDSLDLVVGYNYFKETGNGPQADLVPIKPAWPGTSCGGQSQLPRVLTCNGAVQDVDPRDTYASQLSSQDNRYWGTHGHLTWSAPDLPLFGATELELRGGYQRTDTAFRWDFDASSVPLFNLDSSALSHEYVADARWRGTGLGEALEWQTSLFFSREQADAFTNARSILGQTGSQTLIPQSVENKSYGAALHGAYHISDAVTFQLGGRWTKDRKESLLDRLSFDPQAFESQGSVELCRGTGGSTTVQRRADGSWDYGSIVVEPCSLTDRGTAWGSALEWRPLDGHLLYAGIDRGFKSGGFQLGGVGAYDPEHIWAYKAGTKSEFFDGRLQLNLEGFFYNYEGMQIALIDGLQIRTESADTRMYGVELEANAEPIEGLRLGAVIGHLNTEVLEYKSLDPATLGNTFIESLLSQRTIAEQVGSKPYADLLCFNPSLNRNVPCGQLNTTVRGEVIENGLVDFSGNELSRAPEWKVTLSAEYEIPLGRLGSLTPRVHYAWQDDTYFRVFNRDYDLQEAYHRTDAKLMWESPEESWTAELFVENIEDEADTSYVLVGSRVFNSPLLAWYNTPRFYGFRVGFKY